MRDTKKTMRVTGSSTVTIKPKYNNANNSNQNNRNRNNVSQNNKDQNSGSQSNGGMDGNADTGISRVQTGDESNIFFYAVMLAASAFGLTGLKRRNIMSTKRRDNKNRI